MAAKSMLDGKVVVVTGAGGGIGRDLALADRTRRLVAIADPQFREALLEDA